MAEGRSIYYWRNRWIQALAAMIALTLFVRLLWGWYASRALSRQIDNARQLGQPLQIADLPYVTVPDDRNVWLLQSKASLLVAATGIDSPRGSALELKRWYPPYPPVWAQMAEASEKAHAPAFDLLRKARALHEVDFGTPPAGPMGRLSGYWNPLRQLANVTADSAMYHHVHGDDLEALARNGDVLHLARSIQQDDALISQLIAAGVNALACYNLQVIAPGLRFDRTSASSQPALRAEARKLIDELLDEEPCWSGLRRSIDFERLLMVDSLRTNSKHNWALHPLADLEETRLLRNGDIARRIALIRTKPQLLAEFARSQADEDYWELLSPSSINSNAAKPRSTPYARWFSLNHYPMRYFETIYRIIADRRTTAIDLALQLYRADHQHWPKSLDELVPDYLPHLAPDPYHDDGRPIGYVVLKSTFPDGADRPMLYFDAGRTDNVEIHDEPMYGWQVEERPELRTTSPDIRQYRDVSRFYPPATTQGVVLPTPTSQPTTQMY